METTHRIVTGDARSLAAVEDDSVELVVTSPPYPMIEMWDDLFAELDPEIATDLEADDGQAAFERMHAVLDEVWREVDRVLVDGGIACVNVGDATRSIGDRFRVFRNHDRISGAFEDLGFDPLPEILWRKPTNSGTKFMGSGMVPPNAYVTLEHEYVLVFRNGGDSREFEPRAQRRYDAAYFWEERNRWFSDVWTDVQGTLQSLDNEYDSDALRERSGAFPVEIPYRLINMYSVYGDTVLDPFWGTGTTSLAAMLAARNSVGYELSEDFRSVFDERIEKLPERSRDVIDSRLRAHREFVARQRADGDQFEYEAERYGFPVRTRQERAITFYEATDVYRTGEGYAVAHEPVEETPDRPSRQSR